MRRIVIAILAAGILAMPAAGQTFKEKLDTCLACHGERGQSDTTEVPSLGGQPALFLMFQLVFFRSGQRSGDVMNDIAKPLTDDELRNLTEAIAKLPPPAPSKEPADRARAERGNALIAQHRCGFCHSPDLAGQNQNPRIAAQREDYLLRSLREFKAGKRIGYQAAMAEVMHGLTDADIADLAHYLARVP